MSLLLKYQNGGGIKTDTTIHGGLVKKEELPSNFKLKEQKLVDGKLRTYYNSSSTDSLVIPSIKPKPTPVPTTDPVGYDKIIKDRLAKGETVQELLNNGLISSSSALKYKPFEIKRELYTEEDINQAQKATVNPQNKQTVLYAGANAYRKEIVEGSGNGYKAYSLPDEDGNYTNRSKKVYAVGDRIIDVGKTAWDKNNKIVPHFTGEDLPSEGNVRYFKPSDDGVTRQNTGVVNNFLQPGSTVNRNAQGGNGVNRSTVDTSINTTKFVEPKYDANGKLIGEQTLIPTNKPKEVGKMYPTLKKGGLMKCNCGGMLYKKKRK